MHQRRILSAISFVLLMSFVNGCTALQARDSGQRGKGKTLEGSFETIWNAALKFMSISCEDEVEGCEIFISRVQKDEGLISFRKSIPENMINKHTIHYERDATNGVANVRLFVTKRDKNHTTVLAKVMFICSALRYYLPGNPERALSHRSKLRMEIPGMLVSRRVKLKMHSNGVLEKEYLDRIRGLLKDSRGNNM